MERSCGQAARNKGRERIALKGSPRGEHRNRSLPLVVWLCAAVMVLAGAGCVSKAKANAQARAAFVAGQQQALARAQAGQSPTGLPVAANVMVVGAVRNNVIPWTAGLTLAHALIEAEYFGQNDPKEILINRKGQQIQVDPRKLLGGEDVPIEPSDVIQVQ